MCALGDAFQASVEFEPIAIWVTEFCVEISLGEAFVLRHLKKKERCDTVEPAAGKRSMRARVEAGRATGVTAE